jgi:pyruvate dehydrogenase E2 component (dihydrolipoamide acetyltransferase)
MITEFRLPHLGENITTADIIKLHVKVGDKVSVDQILFEIETDKATVEVPSEINGTINKILVKEGQKAKVGEPILLIDTVSDEDEKTEPAVTPKKTTINKNIVSETKSIEKPAAAQKTTKTSLYEFTIPVLGENITNATITKVMVKPGDIISIDQIVLEIETDKATVEVPTEVAGTVKEVKVKDGDKVAVNAVAFIIESDLSTSQKGEPVKEVKQTQIDKQEIKSSVPVQIIEHTHMPKIVDIPRNVSKIVSPAAPSVRRFAREIGIDIHQVRGSGLNGRISFEDVKTFAKTLNQQIQQGGASAGFAGIKRETLPDFSKWGEIDRQPMSNIRRVTAEHLSYAWTTIPHVTQFDKADITELDKIRKQFSKTVEAAGGKLTVTAVLLKVVASALKVFPQFNSSVDMEKSEVIYKKYFNIGIAVDTDRGLLVPVIRDVDKKNITLISADLATVSKKAREKKLSLDDMQGASITISNLGGIGGTYFTPIINSPEVAIIGVSKSAIEPVYLEGELKPRLMMPLSLSYDHRIIDGADAVRFLRWVINALENPFLLSLEG